MLKALVEGVCWMGKHHPMVSLSRNRVECIRNVPYTDSGLDAHMLDIYRPLGAKGRLPVIVYIHGGAFQLLSKDTHSVMGSLFAQQGFVVFNINYRLAPAHLYPAAVMDACQATRWVAEHAHEFGGDAERLVLAGESAGANLATSVAIAACYQQTESWASSLWRTRPSIKAVVAGCGVLQVSDLERFRRRKPMPEWLMTRLLEIADYLPNARQAAPLEWPLADPLCWLERHTPDRALPPFFSFVGTRDPLLDDTRRLHAALEQHKAHSSVKYYPGGIHAFHGMFWTKLAQSCWKDQFDFLETFANGQ